MNPHGVSCPKCEAFLDRPELYNSGQFVPCPSCGTPLWVEIFPALFRPETRGARAEDLLVEGESGCFYHPQKKAVVPCELCGRFLCALCDVELNGQHLCPACLERGQEKRALRHLENRRVRYDNLALLIALAPLLFWPLTLLTAPLAIYFALRHWQSPTSLVRPNRIRLVLAVGLGLVQILAWVLGLFYAFRH